MPAKPHPIKTPAALRRSAERSPPNQGSPIAVPHTEADARRLVHELEIHQIELEMQNVELRIARDDAEAVLEKYTDLYDFAPVGYFTLTADGTIKLANLTGSVLVGVDRAKLIGRSFGMLVSPDQRAQFKSFLNQVFAGDDSPSAEFELVNKTPLPCVVSLKAQRLHHGPECSVVMMNITERKRAEDRLRISEIRYRRLFETAHDGMLLIDPATCRITDANPSMTRMLRCQQDHLIGKNLCEIGLFKDEAASCEMFRQLNKDHEVGYPNLPFKCADGRQLEVEVVASLHQESGHAVIQCNIRDITLRILAEELARRSDLLFSSLVAQAPIGVHVVDADFRLQQANPTAMSLFENVHPLIGRDFSEIMRAVWPRRVADQIIGQFRHTLETGEIHRSIGFAERRRDTGVREDYESQIQRVMLPSGGYGVVCFSSNITKRIRAEVAQRRVDALTHTNLKLKTEIVRRQLVEGDLRTSRQQKSQLLKQSRLLESRLRILSRGILLDQEEERKRISRELHDVVAQSLVGINVQLAALTQGMTVDPASLAQQICRTQSLVEAAVEIVHRFAQELRPTMLDDLGLIPALRTHLQAFMEETGIRVSLKAFAGIEKAPGPVRTALYRVALESLTNVARHAKASHAEVRIESIDDAISMTIKDNGQGFDTRKKSRAKKGNRLGLLGMLERIEMIGGKFRVESAIGEPTTIHVEIPASKATALTRSGPHAP